jgi:hypothetical protein
MTPPTPLPDVGAGYGSGPGADTDVETEAADGGIDSRQPTTSRLRGLIHRAPRFWFGSTAIGVGYLTLALLYGLFPGQLPDASAAQGGMSACVAQGWGNILRCSYLGYPGGARSVFGMPYDIAAGTLQLLGLDLVNSVRLIWLLVLAIGLWGSRRLLARFTPIAWIAWIGAFGYLVAPVVSLQAGYGPLQLGFMLVPACVLVDLRLLEAIGRARMHPKRLVGRIVAVLVVRLVAMTLDPYSFIIGLVIISLLYLVAGIGLLRVRRPLRIVLLVGAIGFSTGFAYLIYGRLSPVTDLPTMPLSFFRGQGVDVVPQLVPSSAQWWADLVGLHHHLLASQAYSDGPNIYHVFLGYVTVVMAVIGLFVATRSRRLRRWRWAFVIAGFVCAVLALGPTWKFDDFRAVAANQPITFGSYLMPDAEAPNTMPWSFVYTDLPGISQMRALYRWELGVRLTLLVLAVMGLTWLVGRGRWPRRIAVLAAALILVELLPSLPDRIDETHANLESVGGVEADVIAPLSIVTRPGERALLFGPGGTSPGTNDYLANYLCPAARLVCYNVGGDKVVLNAAKSYPPDATAVLTGRGRTTDQQAEQHLTNLLTSGQLEVVVLVHFDLRAQAVRWPARAPVRTAAVRAESSMFTGSRFTKDVHPWFTVVRLAGPAG